MANLPGTLWKSNGAWHWRVKLPGEKMRRDTVLRMPFSNSRIPEDASISMAESAAWRLWEKHAKKAPSESGSVYTVNELVDRWTAHASVYYKSREADSVACGLRTFRDMFGSRPVETMAHADMLAYRDRMLSDDLSRATINKRLGYVKRLVTWGLDELLVSAQTKAELTQISNLKRNRSTARETKPITAAPDADIEAVLEHMPQSIADMIRVCRLTGMRPGELCALNWAETEKREKIWVFRPGRHKNEWRGQPRAIVIGPRAQAVLAKYEGRQPFVFSPALAMSERYAEKRARRKSKVQPSQVDRSCADPMKHPGEKWDPCALGKVVKRACKAAGVDGWTVDQLRHSCATEVRRKFDSMAAHAVLGHSLGPRITDVYSFEAAADEAIRMATPSMLALG